MSPEMHIVVSWMGNILMFGVGIWLIRRYLIDTKDNMELSLQRAVDTLSDKFDTQVKHCNSRMDGLKDENSGCWDAINSHGHKGLDPNGSKVTR